MFSTLKDAIGDRLSRPLITEIEMAYEFAEEKHEGQIRHGNGENYINHPLRVALRAVEYVQTHSLASEEDAKTLIISCLLHDVIEDTNTEEMDIYRLF
jgi:(p)ppGpp synthase/HD superfamily hydrolase